MAAQSYDTILRVLGLVLVEIRATDNLKKAQILADVFHNVPAQISNGFAVEKIEVSVFRRAEGLKCLNTIEGYFRTVRKTEAEKEATKKRAHLRVNSLSEWMCSPMI